MRPVHLACSREHLGNLHLTLPEGHVITRFTHAEVAAIGSGGRGVMA